MAPATGGGDAWTPTDDAVDPATPLLTEVVDTATQPFLLLNRELAVEHANAAFCETFRVTPEESLDRPLFAMGNGQWDIPELRAFLREVVPRNEPAAKYRVEHEFEDIGHRVMLLNARTIAGEDNRPRMILLAIDDATERERRENELIAQRELSDKLIDSVREGLLVLTPDLVVERANDSFYEMFDVTPEETVDKYLYDLGNGQWDHTELRQLLEEVLPEQKTFNDVMVEHAFEQAGRRVFELNGRRLDHMPRILLAIRDVTEARAHERRQTTLLGELQHRVKNVLATVGSMARLLRRDSDDLDDFLDRFEDRLTSLARTQELLLGDANVRTDLGRLVALELEAHGAEAGTDFEIDGPAVTLRPRQAQSMGMIVHELATNAAKYGALSQEGARIEIGWSRTEDEDPMLRFQWRERDVRMPDPAARDGFGSVVLEKAAPYELGGSGSRTLQPDGIVYTMTFPLDDA